MIVSFKHCESVTHNNNKLFSNDNIMPAQYAAQAIDALQL